MKKLIYLLFLFFPVTILKGQDYFVGYEYWFDNDYQNVVEANASQEEIILSADVSHLEQGVHTFCFRAKDKQNRYSTPVVQYFLRAKLDDSNASTVGCEYWLDGNFAGRKTLMANSGLINLEVDVTVLSQGIHFLNYRLIGVSGGTGVCHSYTFLRVEADANDVTKLHCEYWLDSDFANRKMATVGTSGLANFDVDVSDKTPGIHYLNYRLVDAQGKAGAIATHMFLHTHLGQTDPTEWVCEYWFDTNYADAQSSSVNADGAVRFDADVEALSKGIHFLNYRFRDGEGHSSVTSTQCFLRVATDSLVNGRLAYEYWFDHDYANRQCDICYGQLVELNVNTAALSGGIHCLNFRIRDNDESYCPTVTQYFIHSTYNPEDNQLVQYCYWFDDGRPDTVNINPVNPLEWQDKWIEVPELSLPEVWPEDVQLTRYYPEGIIDPEDADKVWLKLSMNQESTFHLRFKTNADIWTQDEPSSFNHENTRLLTAAAIPVNRVSRIAKQAELKVQAHYVDATTGTLCLRSDQPCRLMLFSEDGTRFVEIRPEELEAGTRVEIPQTGRYYALMDKMVKDAAHPQNQVKLVCVTDPLPDILNVEEAGTLPDLLSFTQSIDLKRLTLAGTLNGTDIRLLRNLPALSKLDLGDAAVSKGGDAYDETHQTTDLTIGERMFYGLGNLTELILPANTVAIGERALYGCTGLQEITIPAGVKRVGDGALSGMESNLLVVRWLSAHASVAAEAFDTPEEMGNCLIYAPEHTNASYKGNIIIGKQADAIHLTDEKPFRCPESFKAKEILFVRHFDLHSGNSGQAGGWESIVLPFDVSGFRSEERGELAPFNSGKEGVRPFWLAELTQNEGFRLTTELHANKPYIISMPNSEDYEEEFNIRGNVTFYAGSEAGIEVFTTGAVVREEGQRFALVPVYETVAQHNSVYAINRFPYANQLAGGAFVRNLRDVFPFEAYACSNAVPHLAPAYYGIGSDITDPTGIETLLRTTDTGLNIFSMDGVLYIVSDCFRELGLYGSDGRMLRLIHVEKGKNELHDLPPGIYFIGNRKVILRD